MKFTKLVCLVIKVWTQNVWFHLWSRYLHSSNSTFIGTKALQNPLVFLCRYPKLRSQKQWFSGCIIRCDVLLTAGLRFARLGLRNERGCLLQLNNGTHIRRHHLVIHISISSWKCGVTRLPKWFTMTYFESRIWNSSWRPNVISDFHDCNHKKHSRTFMFTPRNNNWELQRYVVWNLIGKPLSSSGLFGPFDETDLGIMTEFKCCMKVFSNNLSSGSKTIVLVQQTRVCVCCKSTM